MALRTFSALLRDTSPLLCRTLSTVPFDTPARAATSNIVIFFSSINLRLVEC